MNWSLMLNALLLIGVVVAIVRTVQTRRQQELQKSSQTLSSTSPTNQSCDDIIAIRKLNQEQQQQQQPTPLLKPSIAFAQHQAAQSAAALQQPKRNLLTPKASLSALPVTTEEPTKLSEKASEPKPSADSLMLFLLAKSNRQLAGYELLQAILSAGFRFGEGGLFHRHQFPNCQGRVMCSLAAATPSGVFDLQNIGGFVVHGLCIFMEISGQSNIDTERFDVMLDSARTLNDSLDTHLLDDRREPLSEQSIARYNQRLMIKEEAIPA